MAQASAPEATLPVEREVAAAVESQRALAAYLSTQLETQRIQIFDERNQAHQIELPPSAILKNLMRTISERDKVVLTSHAPS